MLDVAEPQPMIGHAPDTWSDVVAVCERIPPLWDLSGYVAVNPFLGYAAEPLTHAARTIAETLGGQVLPGMDYYRTRWAAGAFGAPELAQAARRAGYQGASLEAMLADNTAVPLRQAFVVSTIAERYDRDSGTDWETRLVEHVGLWCAAYLQDGQARAGAGSLYAYWRAAAAVDRSLEIAGLAGWRARMAALPPTPRAAIEATLTELGVDASARAGYMQRLLAGVYGWASYLRRDGWNGDAATGMLVDLLAIRLVADASVAALLPGRPVAPQSPQLIQDEEVRLVFQEALEDGYISGLAASLVPATPRSDRPLVQAVFCIDVRSEPLRRHLEAQSEAIETLGFAGFFGIALEWMADGLPSARCPVLLSPTLRLQSTETPQPQAGPMLKAMQTAPAASFTFVEVLGLAYGLALAGDALVAGRAGGPDDGREAFALADAEAGEAMLATRVDTAASILQNTSMAQPYAQLVLLCGHEGQSANNPHAAGLDCGACGGHGGAINARVAARLLNDPAVRSGLAVRGWQIPADTWFVPAVHNTTLDTVQLLDGAALPATHHQALAQLEAWLAAAGSATRAERAAGLGLAHTPAHGLARLLRRRARDWSEARPEWALARNAAFIAARRTRTRTSDLGGRTFLHEYDWEADHDSAVLGLILAAPVVVASWINLQYLASTVENQLFGAGTKALHNRVGSLGVLLGNGGDLRTGLPIQSVHAADGSWYHEPLRLQVVVEAPLEKIAAALRGVPHVHDLVVNGWLRLFALDSHSQELTRWVPGQGWENYARVAG